ncbi:MAG: serine/threonine-protein kinase [Xenococcaceae cyanobacterium MO_188.B19]|nr:serine/threonine-protein kinase [Xenococcaceae cyanobacterium MO_188.B19]
MALLVGRGKYLLQEEIGRGLSGITYKAINQTTDQIVVIKTFKSNSSELNEASDIRTKFLHEAHRLLECSHPNIIPYREFFSDNGIPYLVMDYVPGKTLDKIVLSDNPLSENTAISYIRQVGEALKVVHNNGLLHRDVKPQNLILRHDNQKIILIDFGLSRNVSWGSVQTHTNFVSDGYAPIEQYLLKTKRTPATDIYGLAATLYTLVTAQIPIAATLRHRVPLESPQKIRLELSNHLCSAIMKGMELELEERPTSVDEWLDLLPETIKPPATPSQAINREPTLKNPSITSKKPESLALNFKESEIVDSTPSVIESDNQNQWWKILIVGLVIFLVLDYARLKLQPNEKDSPTEKNLNSAVPYMSYQKN